MNIYQVSFFVAYPSAQLIDSFAFVCAMLSIAISMFLAVFFFGRKCSKKAHILPLLALNPIGFIFSLAALSVGFERAVQGAYMSSPFVAIYIASIFSIL